LHGKNQTLQTADVLIVAILKKIKEKPEGIFI
jgi:hypothetical protein